MAKRLAAEATMTPATRSHGTVAMTSGQDVAMAREPVAQLAAVIGALLDTSVTGMDPLRGGDVADAYRVSLAGGGRVFAKTHRAPPPGFFTTEAAGLAWLRDASEKPRLHSFCKKYLNSCRHRSRQLHRRRSQS